MDSIILKEGNSSIKISDFENDIIELDITIDNSINIDQWMDNYIKRNLLLEFGNIFVPLTFGKILSDYLGLRFALHLRTTKTKNQFFNIFIYGSETINSLVSQEYFTILKTKGVFLIDYNLHEIKNCIKNSKKYLIPDELIIELNKIHLSVPDHLYNNHSVANIWGMYRLLELEGVDPNSIKSLSSNPKNNLCNIYFKWLLARNKDRQLITKETEMIKKNYNHQLDELKRKLENAPKIDLSKFQIKKRTK